MSFAPLRTQNLWPFPWKQFPPSLQRNILTRMFHINRHTMPILLHSEISVSVCHASLHCPVSPRTTEAAFNVESSPDLNPLDIFFWARIKWNVFATEIHDRDKIRSILVTARDIGDQPTQVVHVRNSIGCSSEAWEMEAVCMYVCIRVGHKAGPCTAMEAVTLGGSCEEVCTTLC
jgi:hypothetical protein